MIYIPIFLTLLTAIAATHLLMKVQKDSGGSLPKWISYIVLVICALILLCLVARGFSRMIHHHEGNEMHCGMHHMGGPMMMGGMCGHGDGMECGEGEMRGMHHGMYRGMGGCEERMEKCEGHKEGCKEMEDDDDAPKDSTAHKMGEKH